MIPTNVAGLCKLAVMLGRSPNTTICGLHSSEREDLTERDPVSCMLKSGTIAPIVKGNLVLAQTALFHWLDFALQIIP